MQNKEKEFIRSKGFNVYDSHIKFQKIEKIKPILTTQTQKQLTDLNQVFDVLKIKDGMTLSFHHHLRNGDDVLNQVLQVIKEKGLKDMKIAASAIFPVHEPMVELIKSNQITSLYCNYLNGPVAKAVSHGYLKDLLIMDSHGGRPFVIETGQLEIDVAFIATPISDHLGNGHGREGKSACGALGYAISDMLYAKHKVVITDTLVDSVENPEILSEYIDYVVCIDQLGDSKGIMSGTTKPTKDPIQLKIAKDTVEVIKALGLLKNGMTFQAGAGGISIAVAQALENLMIKDHIKGKFASGGITSYLVSMLEKDLFENLYDVQCFDLDAVASLKKNENHLTMSASQYANINDQALINDLDVVILGATECDLDFNVNVTTDSNGLIMGGSGGHCDTASCAKVTIITTNLIKSRLPIIKKNVITQTTPGHTVDLIITERGIAIHPNRVDLIQRLKNTSLNIKTIDALYEQAISRTGLPKEIKQSEQIIGFVRYRDGSILDVIYSIGSDL